MNKTITHIGLAIASILVIIAFVTAKSYTQLGIATALYPPVAFLFLKAFPKRTKEEAVIGQNQYTTAQPFVPPTIAPEMKPETDSARVDIADIDKRAFLKLIGGAGLTFFLFSLFSKKAQVPFLGKMTQTDQTTIKDIQGAPINPAERQPLDGYQISEIDDNLIAYYGFINREGGWVIMKEDSDNLSFRYAKGDNGFPGNWQNRERLNYDYFHNIF